MKTYIDSAALSLLQTDNRVILETYKMIYPYTMAIIIDMD